METYQQLIDECLRRINEAEVMLTRPRSPESESRLDHERIMRELVARHRALEIILAGLERRALAAGLSTPTPPAQWGAAQEAMRQDPVAIVRNWAAVGGDMAVVEIWAGDQEVAQWRSLLPPDSEAVFAQSTMPRGAQLALLESARGSLPQQLLLCGLIYERPGAALTPELLVALRGLDLERPESLQDALFILDAGVPLEQIVAVRKLFAEHRDVARGELLTILNEVGSDLHAAETRLARLQALGLDRGREHRLMELSQRAREEVMEAWEAEWRLKEQQAEKTLGGANKRKAKKKVQTEKEESRALLDLDRVVIEREGQLLSMYRGLDDEQRGGLDGNLAALPVPACTRLAALLTPAHVAGMPPELLEQLSRLKDDELSLFAGVDPRALAEHVDGTLLSELVQQRRDLGAAFDRLVRRFSPMILQNLTADCKPAILKKFPEHLDVGAAKVLGRGGTARLLNRVQPDVIDALLAAFPPGVLADIVARLDHFMAALADPAGLIALLRTVPVNVAGDLLMAGAGQGGFSVAEVNNMLAINHDPAAVTELLVCNSAAGLSMGDLQLMLSGNPHATGGDLRTSICDVVLATAQADLTGRTLQLLLDSGAAQITYVDTFTTTTEEVNGGDTSEYKVCFRQIGQTTFDHYSYWVIHIHRQKGEARNSPHAIAAHLKKFPDRKKKVAERRHVGAGIVGYCRSL